jgi:hypothetical protein
VRHFVAIEFTAGPDPHVMADAMLHKLPDGRTQQFSFDGLGIANTSA